MKDISTRYCCSYSQYNQTIIALDQAFTSIKTYAVGTRKEPSHVDPDQTATDMIYFRVM